MSDKGIKTEGSAEYKVTKEKTSPMSLSDLPAYLENLKKKYESVDNHTEDFDKQLKGCLVDVGRLIVEEE